MAEIPLMVFPIPVYPTRRIPLIHTGLTKFALIYAVAEMAFKAIRHRI